MSYFICSDNLCVCVTDRTFIQKNIKIDLGAFDQKIAFCKPELKSMEINTKLVTRTI